VVKGGLPRRIGGGLLRTFTFTLTLRIAILITSPSVAEAHFTLVQPSSWLGTDNGGKGAPPCGEGTPSNIVTKVQGGHALPIKLIETVIHPGHYRIALSVKSRDELPIDPDVFADGGDASVSAVIQNPPNIPIIADGLFPHTSAPFNATWQTAVVLPNINCARCTLQVIEFMAEHGPNVGGGYFYHNCADLEITADPNIPPADTAWTPANVSVRPERVSIKPGATQQFFSNDEVRWTASNGSITNDGVYTAPSVVGSYTVSAVSMSNPGATATASVEVNPFNEELYFAQFANGSQGGTSISSEITLIPLVAGSTAAVTVEIDDDAGNSISPESINLIIPANGSATVKTDRQGPIQTGSVKVNSDVKLSGVIVFSGSLGISGVPDSKRLKKFVVPVSTSPGTSTGIAVVGLGPSQTIQLDLRRRNGSPVAKASFSLGPKQHIAKFVDQFTWDHTVDFSDFSGHLVVTGSSDLVATALLITPEGSAAVPIAEVP